MRTLGEVLEAPERLVWGEWVIFRPDRPLQPTTPCVVQNLDDLPAGVDYPPDAVAAGLTTSLDTWTVQDIVAGVLRQAPGADVNMRLRAFEHYWIYDAFFEVRSSDA